MYLVHNPYRYGYLFHLASTGLLQQCRSGLATIGGNDLGLLHDEYQCWPDEKGNRICRGYGPDTSGGDPGLIKKILGPIKSKIIKDLENWKDSKTNECEPDDKNSCMDRCAARQWRKLELTRPLYGIFYGATCQDVTGAITELCANECR